MIDQLKPYPTYKDSGVPWLGEVPAHWEVRRLKYLLRERDARSETGTEQLLSVSQYVGVTERKQCDNLEEPDTRAESLVGYKRVDPGELVVNIMLAWNGSMGVSRYAGIVSPAYCVYRFEALAEPWYFHHLLRSPVYKARIKAVSTGVVESRLRLYTDDLYRLIALLPPLPEQTAIVRFLDYMDRRMGWYIRARQKRIKLLEEYKQALIHQAVTGQMDVRTGQPYPAYKDSGVEWLGKVPAHWEVKRLKHCTRKEINGATPPTDLPDYFSDAGLPWYTPPSLTEDVEIGRPTKFVSERAIYEGVVRPVNPPVLAVSVIGNVGRCALLNHPAATNQQITCFEIIKESCRPLFVAYQFRLAE